MTRERCDHAWQQQWTTISERPTPVARWVCARCGDATDADPTPRPGVVPARGGGRTFVGSGSWSFRTDSGDRLDAALWLRDTLALPVAPSPRVPPPLADPPALRPWPGDDVETAARAWSAWWAELVDGPDTAPASPPPVFAPFWPEATRVAATTPVEARRQREQFPHAFLVRVVDDVAFDLDVDPGELHGRATVLAVTGPWWCLVAPGRALASADLATDERSLAAMLHAVLRSAVA